MFESFSDCGLPGQLAKSQPLQWMRNRPNDLLNSTRGNPRSRTRTPLPATALSRIRKMLLQRLAPHRAGVVIPRQPELQKIMILQNEPTAP